MGNEMGLMVAGQRDCGHGSRCISIYLRSHILLLRSRSFQGDKGVMRKQYVAEEKLS